MLDTVEPIGLPEAHLLVCPKCAIEFAPKRSNQKFCGRPCAKAATRNASRGNRKAETQGATEQHYERALRLAEMVHSAPPSERFGVMKHILSFVSTDAGLRRILTDPKLLRQSPQRSNKKNIAQAASVYTRMFFGVSIKTYIQQVQDGTVNESYPVSRRFRPRVRPSHSQNSEPKRWYKPVTASVEDIIAYLRAEGTIEANLKADVKQAGLVTEADYERVSAIVAEAQARVEALG